MHDPMSNDAIQVRQMTDLPFDPAKVLPSDLVDFIEPPELKDGEREQVYSIREAAAYMLGVSVRVLESDTSGNIPGDEEINKIQRKAYLIENWLGEHCLQDLENYCFYLGGCKSTGNLLNDSDETAVKFPRRAFSRNGVWILSDLIGLNGLKPNGMRL